jgi:glycosyltransferase involved in cell wall biosynthesis
MVNKIILVSEKWPDQFKSGVSLVAQYHAGLLIRNNYKVIIVGSHEIDASVKQDYHSAIRITSRGSGSLYSRENYDKIGILNLLKDEKPILVVVEAWQTAISHGFIEAASELNIRILVISHGISIHPFSNNPIDIIRYLCWIPFMIFRLPKLVKKISGVTTLSLDSSSNRFYDRDLAKRMNIPVYYLPNPSINGGIDRNITIEESKRDKTILVIGYYSRIKNQINAIRLFKKIINHIDDGYKFRFIGQRSGRYFEKCQTLVRDIGLEKKISFLQDNEVDLRNEIAKAKLLYMPSITEALPITIIEAMSSGTPFVANSVGAIETLSGGIVSPSYYEHLIGMTRILSDLALWKRYSNDGFNEYISKFSEIVVDKLFLNAINSVIQNPIEKKK